MTPEQQKALVLATQAVEKQKADAIAAAEASLQQQAGALRSADSAVADQSDTWADKSWKYPAAIARGTGEGLAATADMPRQALKYGGEWLKKGVASAFGQDYERQPVGSPLRDTYNQYMPAPPQGYENVNDISSVVGPAVVETLATGGFAAPEAAAQLTSGLARTGLGLARGTARTAADVGLGYAGGETGAGVASHFTDNPEIINAARIAGSVAAPTASRGVVQPHAIEAMTPTGRPVTLTDVLKTAVKAPTAVASSLMLSGHPYSGSLSLMPTALKTAQWIRDSVVRTPTARSIMYELSDPPTPTQLAATAAAGAGASQNVQDHPLMSANPISAIARLGY